MQTDALACRRKLIQPILLRLLKEKKEIEETAKRDGKIPEDLCKLCSDSSRLVKTAISPLKKDELSHLSPFLKWMKEKKISSVEGLFYSGMGSIEVETREPIAKMVPIMLDKGVYHYSYSLSELERRFSHSDLTSKFDGLQSCPHFDVDNPRVVHLLKEEDVFEKKRVSNLLFFCCDRCAEEKEKSVCDRGAIKQGFIYSVNCDLNGLVLEKVLQEEGIEYDKGEKREDFSSRESRLLFLRKQEILISLSLFPRLDETVVSVLKPKLIIHAGKKATLVDLLVFNTDVLIVSDEGFYVYDHTKAVEESIDAMISYMADKLHDYSEKARGNDHDRLIMAFENIGKELGFVPQREHGKSGLRVDCVWYDRQGKIQVAIEVETAGG